ncbi:hypothetical protein GN958_ATG05315 [Phytophthora infestans]|uniref:Retrovirus-related Pol polyprotein from transposon TNT 1-94-like beta-barrel domain-containing protein n=1 Tax=Phytophthora infestans TaxID=4787 RepID=A0A8S9V2A3_PHYIN|nr:hypothetical protein GN958_ATG05315 [Phytophthora infestans]
MTGEAKLLTNLQQCATHEVELPDGHVMKGDQWGSLVLFGTKGTKIDEVVFIPGLEKTLLSVSKLSQRGFKCDFTEDGCVVYGPPLFRGKMINGVYGYQEESNTRLSAEDGVAAATTSSATQTHLRTGTDDLGIYTTKALLSLKGVG